MERHDISYALRIALEQTDDLKQADLARAVGVKSSSVSLWFSGKNKPDVENLSKLARVLNVHFEWLATGRGPARYKASAADSASLSPDQAELLAIFARLDSEKKRGLLEFLKKFG